MSKDRIQVFKPLLPTVNELTPYLAQIDRSRIYTNYGPLVSAFEERLADLCGISRGLVVTSCNGTAALTQALLGVVGKEFNSKSLCIVPSWTFPATPASIIRAGFEPYFADVFSDGSLKPASVEKLIHKLRDEGRVVVAVMPVSPFGMPIDLLQWERFQIETGVSVVIDAAASFDSFTRIDSHNFYISHLPVVISLHATKLFGVGEGAFILTSNKKLAESIRRWGNFGFNDRREAQVPGVNSKMSEVAAAYGLALLDKWGAVRMEWAELTEQFRFNVNKISFLEPEKIRPSNWVSSYGIVNFSESSINLDKVMDLMAQRGVDTRRWWGLGCHTQPGYINYSRESMSETVRLGAKQLGLPFWRGLNSKEMDRVFAILMDVYMRVTRDGGD